MISEASIEQVDLPDNLYLKDIVVEYPEPYVDEEIGYPVEPPQFKKPTFKKARQQLVYRRFPWACWIFATLNFGAVLFLIWRLTFGRYDNRLFLKNQPHFTWWHVFLTLILFLLSVLFYVAGKIEIVTIDKDINQIEINKSNLFICMKESKKRDLKDIFAVNLYKKGYYGSMHSTLVYSLKIEFRNDKPLNLLMSRSLTKIRKQVSFFISLLTNIGCLNQEFLG